jgi:PAT family beta-lactamase induction signal transducer AmpG
VVVPFIDPATHYWLFVALAFVLQLGMALYDTCTDGLALDTTTEKEQGIIQGIMVGGRALGVVITASAVGLLAQNVSWLAVFWLLAGLTLLPLPFVLGIQEGDRTVERVFDWKAFAAFKQKTVIGLTGIGFLFFMIIAGVNQLVNPFLQQDFGISLSQAGFYTTVWGVGVVFGGIVGGWLISKIGKRNGVRISLVISVVSTLLLAATPSPLIAWFVVAMFGIAYGTYQTVYFALAMNLTDSRIAASMYSIMMAVSNVAQGAGMALTGFMADSVGFRWTFIAFTAINLLVLPLIPVVFGKTKEQVSALAG